MSVYKKLLAAQAQIKSVPKNGYNKFANYAYATETDVINYIGPILNENGLFHSCETVGYNIEFNESDKGYLVRASVTVRLHIYSPDDITPKGDMVYHTIECCGYAHDKNGDKALFKAITGATKYAYLKGLGIPTGDDPEHDSKEDEDRAKAQYAPKPAPKAPAKPAEPDPRAGFIEMYGKLKSQMATLKLPEPQKAFPNHKAFEAGTLAKADMDDLEDLLNLMAQAIQEAEKGA